MLLGEVQGRPGRTFVTGDKQQICSARSLVEIIALAALEQHFPVPTNISAGARETIRHRYDAKEFRPLAGGLREVSHNQIKLSANAVLALLAGAITQE